VHNALLFPMIVAEWHLLTRSNHGRERLSHDS
jgi:hypothetical protein